MQSVKNPTRHILAWSCWSTFLNDGTSLPWYWLFNVNAQWFTIQNCYINVQHGTRYFCWWIHYLSHNWPQPEKVQPRVKLSLQTEQWLTSDMMKRKTLHIYWELSWVSTAILILSPRAVLMLEWVRESHPAHRTCATYLRSSSTTVGGGKTTWCQLSQVRLENGHSDRGGGGGSSYSDAKKK